MAGQFQNWLFFRIGMAGREARDDPANEEDRKSRRFRERACLWKSNNRRNQEPTGGWSWDSRIRRAQSAQRYIRPNRHDNAARSDDVYLYRHLAMLTVDAVKPHSATILKLRRSSPTRRASVSSAPLAGAHTLRRFWPWAVLTSDNWLPLPRGKADHPALGQMSCT